MIRESVSLEETLQFLNELASQAPQVMLALINHRVPAVPLVQHPTVQCSQEGRVGLLGILNGLFGVYDQGPLAGYGPLTAVVNRDPDKRPIRLRFFLSSDMKSEDEA